MENINYKSTSQKNSRRFFNILRVLFAFAFLGVGLYLLSHNVLIPVYISYANSEPSDPIINPLQQIDLSAVSDSGKPADFDFNELAAQADKHDHSMDFAEDAKNPERKAYTGPSRFFHLTIPKLEIEDALVEIDSENMDPQESLGHFKGTCLPGEACNSFIYGHSTFRYFKNKYKEGDYTEIFSKLEDLEYGDEFIIKHDGKEYRYVVDFSRIQKPEEVDPLGSPYPRTLGKHESTVELFTCTPPGTTKYRLSVVGKLVK